MTPSVPSTDKAVCSVREKEMFSEKDVSRLFHTPRSGENKIELLFVFICSIKKKQQIKVVRTF